MSSPSDRQPLIGLVGTRTTGSQLIGNLGVLGASPIDVFYSDYAHAVIEAGGLPVYLPIDVDTERIVDRLDGLLMTGGTDVDPERYGAQPDPHLLTVAPQRDAFELAVLDAALGRAVPTLGICRGLQIINVHAGGTLHHHVPTHACVDGPPDELTHTVTFEAGTALNAVYGDVHKVNSLHHQAADRIGEGLRVVGRADDGCVEAIEHTTLPVVAVQWHPEMLPTRSGDPVFGWLVDTARRAGA